MGSAMMTVYERLVLRHPLAVVMVLALLTGAALSQVPKTRLDASADSLLLQGDPDLEYFREVGQRYTSEDFLLLTWQPSGDLFAAASLEPLRRMADELRELPGVSSVVTVWDVPLLKSPPVSLGDVSSSEPLPSLEQGTADIELAEREFRSSPIYADLLVSRDGDVTAVQVNLERDEQYFELLDERERLRSREAAGGLSPSEADRLEVVETQFSERSAALIERQAQLVEAVRDIAARYREHASIFVGGVPMIAADMISFVRSDLVVFGSAILGVMVLILALIFRRVRWVVIPVLACSVSVSLMLGLLAALDWRMTVISSNFVAVLLIVALAIAIHLVVRYRELHAADPAGDTYGRVRETVRLMAVPCVYTGVTTMVAFTSLVVSGIQPVIDFGLMMTVGIVVALLVTFTLVPAAMLLWPRARALQAAAGTTPMTVRVATLVEAHGRSIIVLTLLLCAVLAWGISRLQVENRFIDYFKETTEIYQGMELLDSQLGGTIPLEVVLAAPDRSAPLPGLEPPPGEEPAADATLAPIDEGDPFADEQAGFGAPSAAAGSAGDGLAEDDPLLTEDGFAADDPFAVDDPFATDDPFASAGPATTAEGGNFTPSYWFSLEGMRLIDAVHETVDAREETGKVLSLSTTFSVVRDLLGEDIGSVELALVQRSLPPDVAQLMVAPYFDADRDEARLTVRVKETSENLRRAAFLRQLRTELAGLAGLDADQIRFTGMLVLYNNVLQSLFTSQILTLGAVFAVILLMFWVLFRSLTLALLALLPNLLAASLVLGIMGLAGIPLDIMTVTIAAIVVGMGVDNCIHYVHRFKREFPRDRNYLATMYRCHGTIGRALYYTTLTVVVGFSMLTLSNFRPSIYFGLLTVLAMIAAVVGALVLLPRLIILFRPLGREA